MSGIPAVFAAVTTAEAVKMFSSGVTLAIALYTATKKAGRR